VWARTGQWAWLALFLLSMLVAGVAISRDQEDDEDEDDDESDDENPPGDLVPLPQRHGGSGAGTIAAASPMDTGLRRVLTPRRMARRTAYAAALAASLLLPTASAAYAATTKSPANSWVAGYWNYTAVVNQLTPWLFWKLDETTGTIAADSSPTGTRTGTYNPNANATNVTRGIVGALTSSTPNRAVTLTSTNACINTTSTTTMNAPASLTEVVWFKTTTTLGGKLIGFEMPQTGTAVAGSGGTYDRHIYMDGAGKVRYGVYNGGYFTIGSPASYNDGLWHMAAASMGPAGMVLYVDGVVVGTNANTVGESTTGWFRAGCGNLAGWGGSWTGANSPTTSTSPTQNRPFAGSLDEISVWQSALTATQIQTLYAAAS
jgi:hypothetical protein